MAQISLNILLDAITAALGDVSFEANIYIDKVEQGLNDGDFIVKHINTEYLSHGTGSLRRTVSAFDVIYFPNEGNRDCLNMGDSLSEELELIKLNTGDFVRAREKSFEIVDGVLHFKVSYPYSTIKYSDGVNMGNLNLNRGG